MTYSERFRDFILCDLLRMFIKSNESNDEKKVKGYINRLSEYLIEKKEYFNYDSFFDDKNELSPENIKLRKLIYKKLYSGIGLNDEKERKLTDVDLDFFEKIINSIGLTPNDVLLESPLIQFEFKDTLKFICDLKKRVQETNNISDKNYICLAQDLLTGTRLYIYVRKTKFDKKINGYDKEGNAIVNEKNYEIAYIIKTWLKLENKKNEEIVVCEEDFESVLKIFKTAVSISRYFYSKRIEYIIHNIYIYDDCEDETDFLHKIINEDYYNYDFYPANYKSYMLNAKLKIESEIQQMTEEYKKTIEPKINIDVALKKSNKPGCF